MNIFASQMLQFHAWDVPGSNFSLKTSHPDKDSFIHTELTDSKADSNTVLQITHMTPSLHILSKSLFINNAFIKRFSICAADSH
jgi:hypothetical protein